MTIPHGTGWAGVARHRAAHDTRERINNRATRIAALQAEIDAYIGTIGLLQELIATDEELLHNLEEQTA